MTKCVELLLVLFIVYYWLQLIWACAKNIRDGGYPIKENKFLKYIPFYPLFKKDED